MKLTAQIKLLPSVEQVNILRRTLEQANAACNTISRHAWDSQTFRQFVLHHKLYQSVKHDYQLSAQMTVRCLAKVADAYKINRKRKQHFNPTGGIAYDDRLLSWNLAASCVSIWTLAGRQSIPFVAGERQLQLLQSRQGETDLVYVGGQWYLLATCDVEEAPIQATEEVLGVDLGVTNIATDSDGTIYSGRAIKNIRHRHRRLRHKLKKKGTLAAKRRLRKLAGQERRYAQDVNHRISKQLVLQAERTKRAIALEDLTHIRSRVRAKRQQRAVLHSWAFAQLRSFIEYKARRYGVPVVLVDAANTSRICPACGCIDKHNRPTQATFCCVQCAYAGHADTIAAINIGRRAAVNRPHISDTSA
jgi:putative transposase